MSSFSIQPRGPFSLQESALFGFGHRQDKDWDGVMRLAFCLDDFTGQVGVEVRQDDRGVHGTIKGAADVTAVSRQVARVLSLEHDATEFCKVGERDPVVGRLQAAAPGLRPPLFYSPYEATVWSIISSRQPPQQMFALRERLSQVHGHEFDLAGTSLAALPTPEQLLTVSEFPGIPSLKMDRLHGVAHAALEGHLDPSRLRSMEPANAMQELQGIKGIGPFYSGLILIRASGVTDVLPPNESRVRELARRLYGRDATPTVDQFAELAEAWKPWRTWTVVLMRAAASRVLPLDDADGHEM